MAIVAALVYRTVAGQGQYIDAAIHEACALTTEAAIANRAVGMAVIRNPFAGQFVEDLKAYPPFKNGLPNYYGSARRFATILSRS
jgi:crotonobetainyl-CoA:carnitine CoA-transferase CaiB-like acyl-CoA transferase